MAPGRFLEGPRGSSASGKVNKRADLWYNAAASGGFGQGLAMIPVRG